MAGVGWVAAAVLATLIGMGGIRLIGDNLTSTPGGVLDQQDVAKALAASPGPTAASAPTATSPTASSPAGSSPTGSSPTGSSPTASSPTGASPTTNSPRSTSPAGQERGFSATGGSVIAGCRDGVPYLVTWAPSPGYRVTQQETESEHVDVRFEGSGGRSEIRVTCAGNTPVEQERDSGHGK